MKKFNLFIDGEPLGTSESIELNASYEANPPKWEFFKVEGNVHYFRNTLTQDFIKLTDVTFEPALKIGDLVDIDYTTEK